MANWAWPHTPASNCARVLLVGGPFDGEVVDYWPPDRAVPAQIVWSGWIGGFTACLYQWHGEKILDRGRVDALIYRPTGRRLAAEEIPPAVAEDVELYAEAYARWADGAAMIASAFAVPAELIWPGL